LLQLETKSEQTGIFREQVVQQKSPHDEIAVEEVDVDSNSFADRYIYIYDSIS